MIKLKLEKNKKNEPILKMKLVYEDLNKHKILKRVLMESKIIKGDYNYEVPLRFFEVILKNTSKCDIEIDEKSLKEYFEFSDDYDDVYYFIVDINARYMKRWRKEGCPNIYKVSLDTNNIEVKKEISFQKISKINIIQSY